MLRGLRTSAALRRSVGLGAASAGGESVEADPGRMQPEGSPGGGAGLRSRLLGSPPGRGAGPGPTRVPRLTHWGPAEPPALVFRMLGSAREDETGGQGGRWASLLTDEEASPLWPTSATGAMARGGGRRGRGPGVNDVTGISWSASGTRLVVGTSGAVVTFEVEGMGRRQFGVGDLQ